MSQLETRSRGPFLTVYKLLCVLGLVSVLCLCAAPCPCAMTLRPSEGWNKAGSSSFEKLWGTKLHTEMLQAPRMPPQPCLLTTRTHKNESRKPRQGRGGQERGWLNEGKRRGGEGRRGEWREEGKGRDDQGVSQGGKRDGKRRRGDRRKGREYGQRILLLVSQARRVSRELF